MPAGKPCSDSGRSGRAEVLLPWLQPPAHPRWAAAVQAPRGTQRWTAGTQSAPLERRDGASVAAFLGARKDTFHSCFSYKTSLSWDRCRELVATKPAVRICLYIHLFFGVEHSWADYLGPPKGDAEIGRTRPCPQGALQPSQAVHPQLSPSLRSSPVTVLCVSQRSCPHSEQARGVGAEWPKVTQVAGALMPAECQPSATTLNIDTQTRLGGGVQGVLRWPLRERSHLSCCHGLLPGVFESCFPMLHQKT